MTAPAQPGDRPAACSSCEDIDPASCLICRGTRQPEAPAQSEQPLRQRIAEALDNAHRTHPCTCGAIYYYACFHDGALSHTDRRTAAVLAAVQPDLDARDAAIRKLCEETGSTYDELVNERRHSDALREQLAARDAEIQQLRAQLAAAQADLAEANEGYSQACEEGARYRSRWESTLVEARRQAARADELEQQAKNSAWNTMRLGEDIVRLRKKLAAAQAENTRLRGDLAVAESARDATADAVHQALYHHGNLGPCPYPNTCPAFQCGPACSEQHTYDGCCQLGPTPAEDCPLPPAVCTQRRCDQPAGPRPTT